ncbi:Receptor-like protein 9a [Camellia lanceoleosa]|uniref:Receptor-like protein 9a n=1 Tax=Camellia lanceoleosa TaxID=1840588 RepID=A0ACC0FAE1_9ERIC|nr:Receptor-like protein 9a [Camellia lanceoleosa]
MGWSFLGKFAMWVVIILAQVNGHIGGCLERERRGLLEFKDFLKSNGADADHLLPTWVEKPDHHSECCDWERVTCDCTTGHVTELFLHNVKDVLYEDFRIWVINASLFLPFKDLQSLTLSSNSFSGWTDNEGFEKLSTLRKLETLSLEWNEFDDSILPSFSALRSLKMLNLRANKIEGLFPPHELAYFGNLERLDLSYNQFNDIQAIERALSTDERQKQVESPLFVGKSKVEEGRQPLGNISTLVELSMEGIRKGPVTRSITRQVQNKASQSGCESLSRLEKLETLYLTQYESNRENKFNKSIILCLSSLISLKNLSLQGNNLGDPFPARELMVLKNLETLDLSFNEFSSLTIEDSKLLSNLSKMRHLNPSNNNFDKDAFRILGALPSLKFLSLESNRIEGPLSNQGLTSFRHLEILDLSRNNFFASIPPSIGALSSLKALSLAQNNLNGSLSIQGKNSIRLCKLKKLEELDLSYNLFEGILPPCLRNMRSLKFFDISLNQFTETFLHLCLEAFTPSSTLVLVIIVSRVYSHSAHLQTIQTLRWLN